MDRSAETAAATTTVSFSSDGATDIRLVGGKGANLGLLTRAGFNVPPGYTVTTVAYRAFLEQDGLTGKISDLLATVDYDDAVKLENLTQQIRDLITDSSMSGQLADEIFSAYRQQLGDDTYVAVRSSGTAEDLTGASFAGLHDTYLDIKGRESLLDAVRRCWASLWSARAVSYRNTKGFDPFESPIAVVVQQMVPSEVSGVMFTGNPLTNATDEIVINASWGLGEAIVQGITTPDEFLVQHGDLRILERNLGTKKVRIVRNPATGRGNVTDDVPASLRAQLCLPDEQVQELAALGRRIQAHYGDFPQDIEWGYADGVFYALQSRPITAADFSWDADITYACDGPLMTGAEYWSRGWADEFWNGAITPLMFSWRSTMLSIIHDHGVETCGFPELASSQQRLYVYWRGKAFYNMELDQGVVKNTCPPPFRAASGALSKLPRAWHDDINNTRFDYVAYAKMYARLHALTPREGVTFYKHLRTDWLDTRTAEFDGLTPAELERLGDRELKGYLRKHQDLETRYCFSVWSGLIYIFRDLVSVLAKMISTWYDGDNEHLATDLLSGSPDPSITKKENKQLWELAQQIRTSDVLSKAFKENEGGAFFSVVEELPEGKEFLAAYRRFADAFGFRGHADRDIYFTRRAEDPAVDYINFSALLTVENDVSPDEREEEVNARREAAMNAALENIRSKPMGSLKASLFQKLVRTLHHMMTARDDNRHFADRSTFAIKRGYLEVAKRCRERGYLEGPRDHYFLTMDELFDVLDGRGNLPLCRAKIAARMKNFDAVDRKEVNLPMYLHRNKPIQLDESVTSDVPGQYRGMGTSRGQAVGRARVVKSLSEIGRVQSGEILVTNSTDPGWTSVFLIIRGIVLETGGLLAHGSMLAREYGFPAVQIEDAMSHIPDGAMISIDGDAGLVTVLADDDAQTEETAASAAETGRS